MLKKISENSSDHSWLERLQNSLQSWGQKIFFQRSFWNIAPSSQEPLPMTDLRIGQIVFCLRISQIDHDLAPRATPSQDDSLLT